MNRLGQESSPYLRQHADNPVDWYPWSNEAFEEAKQQNKAVLLSIGYSSCHWCHVMAHESFEDPEIAALMNKFFVNVKVDREERPDVDAIYMEAVQAMTGQGGWPMTVFLTPDGRPFFAGTYFPKTPYGGHPGFPAVLEAINDAWANQRDAIEGQANQLRDAVAARTHAESSPTDVFAHGREWLDNARVQLAGAYDKEWGGFGRAPKFPQTTAMEVLLREGSTESIAMVTNTLDAMASGGIYDHLGGGFSRYSVDAFWMVPHFEKMLYDQAALLSIYFHAYQVTGAARYRQVVEETIEYVLRDLGAPGGAFYSAEDADSEGEEGKFYVWRPEEIAAVLQDDELTAEVVEWYGVSPSGNFEGSNILHRPVRGDLLRSTRIEQARQRLFGARLSRIRPGLDDKVLTEWNAMFIAPLAEAGAALGRTDWVDAAVTAADFLLDNLRSDDGRWLRAWHPSAGARQLAYANDYAWLTTAFLSLAEATGQASWRSEATKTADAMLELFWDEAHGGLFTTGHDAEKLIVRSKDLFDGASPSANSTAANALVALGTLTGSVIYSERAQAILDLIGEPLANHPTAFTYFLVAVDRMVNDPTETVVAGDHPELVAAAQAAYLPRNVLLWGERDDTPLWEGRENGAYVCRNQTGGLPALTINELEEQLATKK